jgi:hypothetical protein
MIRRDFLNFTLLGAGAALLQMPAPAFADTLTGFAGVGDYARSNGDPWPVIEAVTKCATALTPARFPSIPRKISTC